MQINISGELPTSPFSLPNPAHRQPAILDHPQSEGNRRLNQFGAKTLFAISVHLPA